MGPPRKRTEEEMDVDDAGALAAEEERRGIEIRRKRGPEVEEEGDDLYTFPLDNRSGKLAKWNTWEKKKTEAGGVHGEGRA